MAVTGLVIVGFTLTIAANLVKFEPNDSARTDKQVFKRIHRFGQQRSCLSISENHPLGVGEMEDLRLRAGAKFSTLFVRVRLMARDYVDASTTIYRLRSVPHLLSATTAFAFSHLPFPNTRCWGYYNRTIRTNTTIEALCNFPSFRV